MVPYLLVVSTGALLIPFKHASLRVQHAGKAVGQNFNMGIDYKDPVVAEEFGKVQSLDVSEVEAALADYGIPAPPTMNEMDLRLMLVETIMRKKGAMGAGGASKAPPSKPASYQNEFQRVYYEHPAFYELFEACRAKGDTNSMNVITEYMNNRKVAVERYQSDEYKKLIADIEEALAAPIVQIVTTPKVRFSGFPSNMGEEGVKMTLAALGPIQSFAVSESDDPMICCGVVEYEEVDTAKAAIEKYDGMDMGLGTKLELRAL